MLANYLGEPFADHQIDYFNALNRDPNYRKGALEAGDLTEDEFSNLTQEAKSAYQILMDDNFMRMIAAKLRDK